MNVSDALDIVKNAARLCAYNPPLFATKVWRAAQAPPRAGRQGPIKLRGVVFDGIAAVAPSDLSYREISNGYYEIEIQHILRSFLRPGDTFVDVGANIGYISALAAGIVGPGGRVISFEPVPRYFQNLQRLAQRNPGHRIEPHQLALGADAGTLQIRVSNVSNIGWNTAVPGFMSDSSTGEIVEIPADRLDRRLALLGATPNFIKIDVEGYELPVLLGLGDYLARCARAPLILCEINPAAYTFLGRSLAELEAYMGGLGFVARDIVTLRPVRLTGVRRLTNLLFCPT